MPRRAAPPLALPPTKRGCQRPVWGWFMLAAAVLGLSLCVRIVGLTAESTQSDATHQVIAAAAVNARHMLQSSRRSAEPPQQLPARPVAAGRRVAAKEGRAAGGAGRHASARPWRRGAANASANASRGKTPAAVAAAPTGLSPEPGPTESLEGSIRALYAAHAPHLLPQLAAIMARFAGQERELLQRLEVDYGVRRPKAVPEVDGGTVCDAYMQAAARKAAVLTRNYDRHAFGLSLTGW